MLVSTPGDTLLDVKTLEIPWSVWSELEIVDAAVERHVPPPEPEAEADPEVPPVVEEPDPPDPVVVYPAEPATPADPCPLPAVELKVDNI